MRFARAMRGRRTGRRRSIAFRILDVALAAAFLGLLAFAAGRVFVGDPQTVSGMAMVPDGDSLVIDGERIRLEGIDAPELAQSCARDGEEWPCGVRARERLAQLVANRAVTCEAYRRDRYDRLLARCTVAGVDLALTMVEEGWAVAYGGYEAAEARAHRARTGIWSGSFERPQDWRHSRGGATEGDHGGFIAWLYDIWRGRKAD